MTKVAILWHMHQPYYEDLATGEHILPWARMHALKDYYGMAALLDEFPKVKLTFNLVPSLLVQIEAFAEDRARDAHLALGLTPAGALTDDDRARMLAEFFHAPRGRMIDLYPRYGELLQKRDSREAWSRQDLLDLQVWHKLAWVDPFYLDADPRVRALLAKGRGFDEDDKATLRAVELEILRRIIPTYRAAAERGQAELSTSPFYHPILPLLCDTDVYLATHPYASVPRPPFRRPEDAAEQLARARACHQRLFGRAPAGLWPSEGSVSDAVVRLAADAGFRWMATDEAILGRTIGREFRRDGEGRVDAPEALYRPHTVRAGASGIQCLFRDHALSDLIGFVYAGWEAEAAAADFVDHLAEAGRRFQAAGGGEEATIPIILDGENAWENFAGGGRPFLRALYGRLSDHPDLRTVTMAEAADAPATPPPVILPGLFPGSWIDGNFSIWIGHADDQRAWRQLGEARRTFDVASVRAPAADRDRAFEELLIAEGSDWCWWYGDDHSSDHDLEFDELFRRHLRNVYQLVGEAIPDELFVTNISTGGVPLVVMEPVGLITPAVDGRPTSYFEWLSAGRVETDLPAGAMAGAERKAPLVRQLLYGFDLAHLYIRLDLTTPASRALAGGLRCQVSFTAPSGVRVSVFAEGEQVRALPASVHAVAGDILELAVPFAELGLAAGDVFAFSVSLHHGATELERHPAYRPVEGHVPAATFERIHWKA